MKNPLLLPMLFFFFTGTAFAQSSTCLKAFRTGTFTYEGMEDKVEIIRTKKEQIEIYNNGESRLILKIKWINDSVYVLTHKKSINAAGCLRKGDIIETRIVSCDANRYLTEFASPSCGKGTATFVTR